MYFMFIANDSKTTDLLIHCNVYISMVQLQNKE